MPNLSMNAKPGPHVCQKKGSQPGRVQIFKLVAILFFSTLMLDAVHAQCTVTATGQSIGSSFSVVVTLHTNDPNENGEGEPLQLTGSGAVIAGSSSSTVTIFDYEIPHSVSFTALTASPVVVGQIVGLDGDEFCDISLVKKKRFSDDVKTLLTEVAAAYAVSSAATWVADAICLAIVNPICGIPLALLAASEALVAALAGAALAVDPPDPNYKTIVVAVPATFTPVAAGGTVTVLEAAAANALLANQAAIVGVLRAILITLNRASTAEDNNDTVSAARQLQALDAFLAQLAALFVNQAPLRVNLVAAMKAAGVGTLSFTSTDVFNFESSISSSWDALQLAIFNSFGADAFSTERARQIVLVQDINAVANLNFPDGLASPALLGVLLAFESILDLTEVTTPAPTDYPSRQPTLRPTLAGRLSNSPPDKNAKDHNRPPVTPTTHTPTQAPLESIVVLPNPTFKPNNARRRRPTNVP